MTITQKWIAAGIAFVVVLLVGRMWLEEHDARLKAESVATAQSQVIAQAHTQIDTAKANEAKTAADLQKQIAALEAQKQQPISAPQFVMDMSKVIPNLPQAATVVQLPATQQTVNGKTETVPGSQAVEIPAADLPALRDYKVTCDENSAKLNACSLTLAQKQTEVDGGATQLKAMTVERDTYKAAEKGGTLLHRLGKKAKCLAISGGFSALGAWADKSQPARGALIGATAGGVGCELF